MVTASVDQAIRPSTTRSFSGTALIQRILTVLLLFVAGTWLVVPFGMALIWSLVDPSVGWEYPDLLPEVLSFARWAQVWNTTSLPSAMANSYMLAPTVAVPKTAEARLYHLVVAELPGMVGPYFL